MNFKKSDSAVSPILGILLMLVVTLIMASVVTACVFGVGESLSRNNDIDDIVYFNASTTVDVPIEYTTGHYEHHNGTYNGSEE